MTMLNAILIDDDESNLSSLQEKLGKHCPQVIVVAQCNSAKKGIEAIENLKPDLVFLDIEMPVMNGFLMLQQLAFRNFDLIFVTAYDHFAIKAIRYSALDYLVKPVVPEDLIAAIERSVEKRNIPSANSQLELLLENIGIGKKKFKRIALPSSEGIQFVRIDDIIYLEASINYTHLYVKDNHKYTVSRTLKDFEDMLPPEIFLRIHNSYIINKDYVEKYIRGDGGQVILTNGTLLDVSKRKKTEFLKAIGY